MSTTILMRDAFIDEIYKAALNDKDIIFISADFGAAALDDFRENLSDPEKFKGELLRVRRKVNNMVDIYVWKRKKTSKIVLFYI